jgi:lipopolysaccharide export system protein LptA
MAKMNANFMPMMSNPVSAFSVSVRWALMVLAAAGTLSLTPAWAEKADRYQPLNFAADSARVDDAQRLNILIGNVEISKGSMIVRSDRVEVRQNADGTQTATAIGGAGGRAFFRQKRDGLDESIEGEAENVVYDGKTDTVRFTGRAIMRRLRGAGISDQVSGQVVIYDNKTSVFQVVGTADSGSATPGRVRGVITPRASEPAGASLEGGR